MDWLEPGSFTLRRGDRAFFVRVLTMIESTGERLTTEARTRAALRSIAHNLRRQREVLIVLAAEVGPLSAAVGAALGREANRLDGFGRGANAYGSILGPLDRKV